MLYLFHNFFFSRQHCLVFDLPVYPLKLHEKENEKEMYLFVAHCCDCASQRVA